MARGGRNRQQNPSEPVAPTEPLPEVPTDAGAHVEAPASADASPVSVPLEAGAAEQLAQPVAEPQPAAGDPGDEAAAEAAHAAAGDGHSDEQVAAITEQVEHQALAAADPEAWLSAAVEPQDAPQDVPATDGEPEGTDAPVEPVDDGDVLIDEKLATWVDTVEIAPRMIGLSGEDTPENRAAAERALKADYVSAHGRHIEAPYAGTTMNVNDGRVRITYMTWSTIA